ncbi:MAG TPA: DUF6390 family protein [Patescibacteria group bacterium]|jgi:hypothetical protein|nr:DUF6390 family protein [Patescibacteria group bacterium]
MTSAAPVPATSDWTRPIPPAPGPIRFARYAFGPNRLGYCGPDEAGELFAQATLGQDLRKLRELAGQFEGAYPYLCLIADGNGVRDPLDAGVVEAYWLGNSLLGGVRPRDFGGSLDARFRARLRGDGWRWLGSKPELGAVPNHAFHVLDVFPKVGMLRTGEVEHALEVMDSCRIRWGRVLERDGDALVVSAVPLTMIDGKLRMGPPRVERIRGWLDGAGFVDEVTPGDVVSIHWDWACERLDARRLAALRGVTATELELANRTI